MDEPANDIRARYERCTLGLAATLTTTADSLLIASDWRDLVETLFHQATGHHGSIIAAGPLSADVALAADRAEVPVIAVIGPSPFTIDTDSLLAAIESPRDMLYVEQPHTITGAALSTRELRQLLLAVPEGLVIVDEQFGEYCPISALPLLEEFDNLVVLRSIASPLGVSTGGAGYLVTDRDRIAALSRNLSLPARTTLRFVESATGEQDMTAAHARFVHDEMHRLAAALLSLGVPCRLSPTDFLLIQVNDADQCLARLSPSRNRTTRASDHESLTGYLRYPIQNQAVNNRFVCAVERLPEAIRIPHVPDMRSASLVRANETCDSFIPIVTPESVLEAPVTASRVPAAFADSDR